MQNQGRKEGLTLLEVVVTIFLVSIIGAAILNLFDFTAVYYNKSIDKERSRKEARFATQWIKRDVSCNTCLYNANSTSLSLNVPDWGFVKYYLANNTTLLRENGCSSSPQLVSKNLTDFNLTYYDAYNQLNASPVRLVEVNVASQVGEESYRGYIAAASPLGSDCLWARSYGAQNWEYVKSLQQTQDGGYILGGYTWSFGAGQDGLVIKTDAGGNIIWTKTYGGGDDEYFRLVQQTDDNGYILGSRTKSFGAGGNDFLIIKTDAQGTPTWAKTYGSGQNEQLFALSQTSDGGYILGGYTGSFGAVNKDFFVIKTNENGNISGGSCTPQTCWKAIYGGNKRDELKSIQQTEDGYILGGSTLSFGAVNKDLLVIKTDSQGNLTWAKRYGDGGDDQLSSFQQTFPDGGYILGGYTDSSGAGNNDILIVKTNSQGNITWEKTYGSTNDEYLHSLQQISDGYILGGATKSFGAGEDFLVIKIDTGGNLTWAKRYGSGDDDYLVPLQQTQDGGYIMGGYTDNTSWSAGDKDFFVIKTDSSGNLDCCSIDENISLTVSNATLTTNTSFSVTVNTTFSPINTTPSVDFADVTLNTTLICPQ